MIKTLLLDGFAPKSKARPRFNSKTKRAYMPEEYQAWRDYMEVQLMCQWRKPPVKLQYLILFFDVLDFRSDADNLGGSVMDCMVKAGKHIQQNVISNDTLEHVPNLLIFSRKVESDPKIYITLIHSDLNPNIQLLKYLVKMLFPNPLKAIESLKSYFLGLL